MDPSDGLRIRPCRDWMRNWCTCEDPVTATKKILLGGPDGIEWCRRCGRRAGLEF